MPVNSSPGAVGVQRLQQPAPLLRSVLLGRRPGDDVADHRVEVELGALRAFTGGLNAVAEDWQKHRFATFVACRTPTQGCGQRNAINLTHAHRS